MATAPTPAALDSHRPIAASDFGRGGEAQPPPALRAQSSLPESDVRRGNEEGRWLRISSIDSSSTTNSSGGGSGDTAGASSPRGRRRSTLVRAERANAAAAAAAGLPSVLQAPTPGAPALQAVSPSVGSKDVAPLRVRSIRRVQSSTTTNTAASLSLPSAPSSSAPTATAPGVPSAAIAAPVAFPATQLTPTALPEELVELSRAFRATVERVAANPALDHDEAGSLHRGANDLLRYVTAFLMARSEEQRLATERRAHGWCSGGGREAPDVPPALRAQPPAAISSGAAAPSTVDAAVVGPFMFNSVYGAMVAALQTLRAERGTLWINDAASGELVSMVLVGASVPMSPLRIPNTSGVAGAVLRTGIAVNVLSTERAPASAFHNTVDSKTGFYTQSIITFPLFRAIGDIGTGVSSDARGSCDGVTDGSGGGASVGAQRRGAAIGVVQYLNKVRLPGSDGGFTPEDEAALHHHAQALTAMLQWGGGAVDFVGATAEDESWRVQRILTEQHHFSTGIHRWATAAGCHALTITEATASQRRQRALHAERERAAKDATPLVENPIIADAVRVASGPTLVLRVGGADDDMAAPRDSAARGAERELAGMSVGRRREAARDRDVRDVAQFLERIEVSWKEARETCIRQDALIQGLRAHARHLEREYHQLRQLCVECGIVANGAASADIAACDEDLDDAAFARRLERQHADAARHHNMVTRLEVAVAERKAAAALAPVDAALTQRRLDHIAQRALDGDCGDGGGGGAMKEVRKRLAALRVQRCERQPVAGESAREREEREALASRVDAVQRELEALVARHRGEVAELTQRHRAESKDAFAAIAARDVELAAALATSATEQRHQHAPQAPREVSQPTIRGRRRTGVQAGRAIGLAKR